MNISNWSENNANILEKIRCNSVNLSEWHRTRYYYFKGYAKYFDLPILVLSSFSASFLMGANTYIEQNLINLIGSGLNLGLTILSSIKMYLNINENMNNELQMSKEFYTLAIDIYRMLSLDISERPEGGMSYLNKKFAHYTKLVENSNLLKKKFKTDQLTIIPPNLQMINSDSESLSSQEEQKEIELQENIIENNL